MQRSGYWERWETEGIIRNNHIVCACKYINRFKNDNSNLKNYKSIALLKDKRSIETHNKTDKKKANNTNPPNNITGSNPCTGLNKRHTGDSAKMRPLKPLPKKIHNNDTR